MTLTSCPDCGWKVSTDAKSCPGCGRPLRLFDPRPWMIAAEVATFAVLAYLLALVVSRWLWR